MHTYDAPRRLPYSSPVPALRPAQDFSGSCSATPIYDALYAEYLRTFRSLPGDRNGEEDLGFKAFGISPGGPGLHGPGLHGSGLLGSGSYNSGAYTPTAYGMRHVAGQHQTGQVSTHQSPTVTTVWQPVARQHATGLIPAALPPGPRRER
ncbi:hypothetical protein ACFWBR_41155 [Streptomyces sp. NPDC060006]|uniref:hypothetical protein n=1 Tax=unclassified Streptomyces TaxID=2593676 RepID=UPI0036B3BE93